MIFDDDNDRGYDYARHNGTGTHHDRFLTSSEMMFIGITLWKGLQWYRENNRRLTPEEQAAYNLDVKRWEAYLAWEAENPAAYEARMQWIAEQQAEAQRAQYASQHRMNNFLLWVAILFIAGFSIHHGADEPPALWLLRYVGVVAAIGFVKVFIRAWRESWRRTKAKVQADRAAAERANHRYLPVKYDPNNI